MRRLSLLIIVLLFSGTPLSAQAPPVLRVTADFRGLPLEEVIDQLEATHGLGFNFLVEAVKGKTADCHFKNAEWTEVAHCLFSANGLEVKILPQGYVSLREVVFPVDTLLEQLSVIDLSTVHVSEYVTDGITATPDGKEVRIRPDRSPPVPGSADHDLFRQFSLLPGITSLRESAGDLSIRGGNRDQNLVLWDGIPVYSSGHYFGMIGNFSPELIDQVSVWRGRAEAAYGGRVSGVIRMETDKDITTATQAGGGISLLQSDGFVKVPVVKGKSDVHLSFRSTLPFLVTGPAYNSFREQVFQDKKFRNILAEGNGNLAETETFGFGEFNGRWQYNFSPESRLTLSAFSQKDDFQFELGNRSRNRFYRDALRTENQGGGLRYRRDWGQDRSLSVHLAVTDFNNRGTNSLYLDNNQTENNRTSGIQETTAKLRYQLPVGANGKLEIGSQWQRFEHRFSIARETSVANRIRKVVNNGDATALAAFGAYVWEPTGPWRAEIGLRLPHYGPTGQLYVEPRLSGSYQLNRNWLLQAGYGVNHQYPQEVLAIDPTQISASAPLWTLADGGRFPVQSGREASFGISGQPRGWRVDLEVYHKRVAGLSSLTLAEDIDSVQVGNSRAIGLDLLLKRRWGKWRTWAIYSLSQTEWQFPERDAAFFPAENDRRHQLRLMNTYSAGPWSFSAAWRVQTGGRYTPITGLQRVRLPDGSQTAAPVFAPINSATLPLYHRLDLSLFYDWKVRDGKGLHGRIGFSLLNVYGHENILERRFLVRTRELSEPGNSRFDIQDVNRTGLGFTPNLRVSVGWR